MTLEELEPRVLCSADYSAQYRVVEFALPDQISNLIQVEQLTAATLVLGQFGAGVSYSPNLVIRYDLSDAQALELYGDLTTAREVLPILGGQVPVVFAPNSLIPHGDNTYGGLSWEF